MTLKQSLTDIMADRANTIRDLQTKVSQIPDLLKAAEDKAVADYVAANPPATGSDDIDGVTQDDIVQLLRDLAEDNRTIEAQASGIINFFENNRVHGDPYGGAKADD